jgi:diguanylate cyclase (GGDEF)-like protein
VTADTDELTGLLGRRPFRPMLQAALDDPSNSSVALALVDVDEFKRVNDRLGHAHGDRVLVALAESIGAVRAGDRAFRLGGDEFAVVLPNAAEHRAAEIVQRVRDTMTELMPGVTFSCGVAASAGGAAAIPAAGAHGTRGRRAVRVEARRQGPHDVCTRLCPPARPKRRRATGRAAQ